MLAALAHGALSSEEIFGRGLVSYQWSWGHVTQAIDALGHAARSAANQAATFFRAGFTRVRDKFVKLPPCDRYHRAK
jgi:hypothetical protein